MAFANLDLVLAEAAESVVLVAELGQKAVGWEIEIDLGSRKVSRPKESIRCLRLGLGAETAVCEIGDARPLDLRMKRCPTPEDCRR